MPLPPTEGGKEVHSACDFPAWQLWLRAGTPCDLLLAVSICPLFCDRAL